ncbi:hypothetical protein D0439_15345 [Lysinibacillus fusiformis]|uniref:Uncharacterized protein n=1 Tax=Lysinibacillus fusiformis TaxID=28031 RepID=A0A1E4R5A4_9BACI|nr:MULTISPECIES: hypothetical protein [Lysinibacillus]HBJ02896.1 hypothetical protein [Lysinibacillus sp.]KAB0441462.1 hypothetical protein CH314_15625 [Lysinibacillus fusiformis]KEK10054.1 hypothetical protein EP18_23180 [Lysinibacillus sphaericus]KGA83219.1 hypothetical protein KQ41_12030 [Lysinibacillus fusiformis]MBD8520399.1 hypothetical protein [Lysinibacillus fusiformis]
MSEFQQSKEEIQKVDHYLDSGFKIKYVYENLSGMFVEFARQEEVTLLQILTADARKYFTAKLQEQTLL